MNTAELWAEFHQAQAAMTAADRALMGEFGVAPGHVLFLVGVVRGYQVNGGLYQPNGSATAYVSPALTENVITPEANGPEQAVHFGEITDLVLWHPRRPAGFALRRGAAEWLGSCPPQLMGPEPVQIWRAPLRWFQAGCAGLCVLARDRASRYRVLSGCGSIIAEDVDHARELREILQRPWRAPPVMVNARSSTAAHCQSGEQRRAA